MIPAGLVVQRLGLPVNQPPWSFGLDSQTRGTRENRAPPCLKYRVPHGSQLSSSTHAHSFVLGTPVINNNIPGSIPKREELGKTDRS
jgi:hypothetical protein